MKQRIVKKMRLATMDTPEQPCKLYIRTEDCGIPFLVLMIDAMPIILNGSKKWIAVDDALSWYAKEMKVATPSERERYAINVSVLQDVLRNHPGAADTRA